MAMQQFKLVDRSLPHPIKEINNRSNVNMRTRRTNKTVRNSFNPKTMPIQKAQSPDYSEMDPNSVVGDQQNETDLSIGE